MFSSYMPVRVLGGEEILLREGARLRALGTRCLIVTGKTAAQKSGALDDLTRVCEEQGIAWETFDEIEPNPNVLTCFRAAARARMFGAEFVVGIGGGSPLDACKVVALLARNDIGVRELYAQEWTQSALPVVCVGTTAGTGSEVTRVSVLTVDGRKRSITSDALVPTLSFCDPRYTRTCGYEATMSCGLDALCHALEGYFAARATPLTDSIAVQAVRTARDGGEISGGRGDRPGGAPRRTVYRRDSRGVRLERHRHLFPARDGLYSHRGLPPAARLRLRMVSAGLCGAGAAPPSDEGAAARRSAG